MWRRTGLTLTALVVSGVWLYVLYFAIELRPEPPSPSNAISAHTLASQSNDVALVSLIDEKDWEMTCLIEENIDPALAAERPFTQTIRKDNEPVADRLFLRRLWKIVIIKGDMAAVYYLDNRQIERAGTARCMPLKHAVLSFQSEANHHTVQQGFVH